MAEPERPKVEIPEAFRDLPPDKQAKLSEWVGGEVARAMQAIVPKFDDISRKVADLQGIYRPLVSAIDDVKRRLTELQQITSPLAELEARTGEPEEDILRKALALYEVASEAAAKGNRLAILAPDDEIVREIVGVGASDAMTHQAAK